MSKKAPDVDLAADELRAIAGYATRCALRVLDLFEVGAADPRPRQAIDAAQKFASGGPRTAALRAAGWAAYAAARAARDPAGAAAAHSATHAASAAFLHPKASPHQVKHILGAAAYAAHAMELAHPDEEGAAETFIAQAAGQAPAAVRLVLLRFPNAPAGGGRVGELVRQLDAALRR